MTLFYFLSLKPEYDLASMEAYSGKLLYEVPDGDLREAASALTEDPQNLPVFPESGGDLFAPVAFLTSPGVGDYVHFGACIEDSVNLWELEILSSEAGPDGSVTCVVGMKNMNEDALLQSYTFFLEKNQYYNSGGKYHFYYRVKEADPG